jgi:threonylcarbamoyladenosine tRNA methylthiotransferase MtaB
MIDFILSSKHFVPHFHIPLQSGSDEILKKMQRKYNVQLFLDKINYIFAKNPLTALGIDVIVGFPGETAEHFNQTFSLLKTIPFSYLHVFEYSERKGTKAALLPDKVKDSVKKERSNLLHQLSNEKHVEFVHKNLNLTRPVLIERKIKDGNLMGFTDNYIKVSLPYESNLINTIVEVKLKSLDKQNKIVEGEKL